jgi:flavodoxin
MKTKGKTAVIYYSYEGNTALAARTIAASLGAECFEIKTTNTKKRSGFVKYLWGVAQVMTRKKPALAPLAVDPNAYDLIVLGTPVWASNPAPAMVSFLGKTAITGKKIALFCCHAGGKGEILDTFKSLVPGNTVIGEIDFINPAKGDSSALKEKVDAWAELLRTAQ